MRKFVAVWLVALALMPDTWGQARLFVKANSDKITTGSDGTTPYASFSLWFWLSSLPALNTQLWFYSDGNNQGYASANVTFGYINDGGTYCFFFSEAATFPGGQRERKNNVTLNTGQWYHLVMVVDPSQSVTEDVKFWVDGTSIAQSANYGGALTGPNVAFYGTAGIGVQRLIAGDVFHFDGRLSNLCFWAGGDNSVLLNANERGALDRRADCLRVRPEKLTSAWRINGLDSPERDLKRRTYTGTVTGTSRANGPPLIPRP
jgi:hypothetical protein